MRFAVLGSGSRGNATLIETGSARVLIDCGFGLRETRSRLAALGVEADSIDALVVTHEHGDHGQGVARFANRHGTDVWATPGTWKGLGQPDVPRLRLFSGHGRGFRVGDMRLLPFPVPHDAREPSQFVFEAAGRRVGMLTDAGTVTARAAALLGECDALVLEANHDVDMLNRGPYPPRLRERVGGAFGHLSNAQAAALVDRLDHKRLSHLLLAHISAKNNHADLARAAILEVSSALDGRLSVAEQDRVSPWHNA